MEHQLKWHKFLIYFSLWLNAVSSFLLGAMGIGAMIDPPGRYRYNESLQWMAALIGAALIAVGIYTIVTRFKLAKFRRCAPDHLMAVWILSGLLSTVLMLVDGLEINFISSMIPTLAMASVNHYYYKKREKLFIH